MSGELTPERLVCGDCGVIFDDQAKLNYHLAAHLREGASEKLSPERAMRLLRAKAAELEHFTRNAQFVDMGPAKLAADISLVASILADFMEHTQERLDLHVEIMDKTATVVSTEQRVRDSLAGFLDYEPEDVITTVVPTDRHITNLMEATQERHPEWGPNHPDYDNVVVYGEDDDE